MFPINLLNIQLTPQLMYKFIHDKVLMNDKVFVS